MKKFELTYDEMNLIKFCLFSIYINGHLTPKDDIKIKNLIDKIRENSIKPNEIMKLESDEMPF